MIIVFFSFLLVTFFKHQFQNYKFIMSKNKTNNFYAFSVPFSFSKKSRSRHCKLNDRVPNEIGMGNNIRQIVRYSRLAERWPRRYCIHAGTPSRKPTQWWQTPISRWGPVTENGATDTWDCRGLDGTGRAAEKTPVQRRQSSRHRRACFARVNVQCVFDDGLWKQTATTG